MNKVILNIKYKFGLHFKWLLIYLAIYILTMSIVYFALIQTSIISAESGGLFYRLWGVIFLQLGVSLKFQEDYDFFLTLSNTRMAIYQSLVGVGVGFSMLLTLLIILEQVIVDLLNGYFGFHNITDPIHFIAPYLTDNLMLQFIFFWMLCICFAVFGLMMGSLSYRFGKFFILASWLLASGLFILFLPWLLWTSYQNGSLSNFTTSITEYFINFDLLINSGYLLILSLGFAFAAFLNIRRLPQK